ncbi:unnamed protein product [Arabis nemorensis]|uniref:Phorbol-ester/DAG-type domain-containing protein n=1 Tax=Arabis nemorensis TaxID=586526 RepID=A0A565BMK1_9BRAS|nr:unnamed protein product [Arabis nemorensis]
MAELQHGSHECALTLPKMVGNGICNMCFKDEPVEFACEPCNFDLCKSCSDLPLKMSHHLHPEHPLEFCIGDERKSKYMICIGCGNMSSGSFYYECKKCEIYLDMDCALQKSIVKGWEATEMLHYSHEHMFRRCRPGPNAKGSCLLCELPLSPSAICYGCVHCQLFFHERCLDLPTEIQHPVHPAHPLKRLDYIQAFHRRKICNACKFSFAGAPFGCLECGIYLHLRCADALLRGLMHNSHEHRLFYVEDNRVAGVNNEEPCQICMETVFYNVQYYYCVICDLKFHIKCLEIPKYVVNKSYHIHQLERKRFRAEDSFLEYCGVCETIVNSEHPAYSCKACDFLGHTECILREEMPSPLYLKELYSCSKSNTISTNIEDLETEDKLLVNGINHIHAMRTMHMSELEEEANCNMCDGRIHDNPCKCETCSFQSHDYCAELGRPSRHQFHLNHSLTLLPNSFGWVRRSCKSCKKDIEGFNLFCRVCNFIIDISCALKSIKMLGALHMGQKIIGAFVGGLCIQDQHSLFNVVISRSYPTACALCDEKLCGKALSCVTCDDICHPLCIEVGRRGIVGHLLHSDHKLAISLVSESKCTACQLDITKYGYRCFICEVNFHIECNKLVILPRKTKPHSHYLYNFWKDVLRVTQACNVCARPCGVSFYGCIDCDFSAHAECIGFPSNVKNQRHQHTLTQTYSSREQNCSLCESYINSYRIYSCYQCKDVFHFKCIMSTENCEAILEEDQLQDIYLMYLERDLFDLLRDNES